jgi:hypothetical protein
MINNLPRVTSHGARKQFVDFILAQRSLPLKKAEEYTLCNKDTTAVDNYLGKLKKKVMAVLG